MQCFLAVSVLHLPSFFPLFFLVWLLVLSCVFSPPVCVSTSSLQPPTKSSTPCVLLPRHKVFLRMSKRVPSGSPALLCRLFLAASCVIGYTHIPVIDRMEEVHNCRKKQSRPTQSRPLHCSSKIGTHVPMHWASTHKKVCLCKCQECRYASMHTLHLHTHRTLGSVLAGKCFQWRGSW